MFTTSQGWRAGLGRDEQLEKGEKVLEVCSLNGRLDNLRNVQNRLINYLERLGQARGAQPA